MAPRRVKLGVLAWPQYTDWASLRDAGAAADRVGLDSLWTWDHLYPIVGSPEGPEFEGYMTIAGWASVTEHVTLGLLVGANTFRNPALVVKMVTALDHISGGRAVLGLGGAWFQLEHDAFGFDFGSSTGERLDWLDEAAMIVRGSSWLVVLGNSIPKLRSRPCSPSAIRNPKPSPTPDATMPTMSASARTDRLTCLTLAPSARSKPSSRVRCAIRIENVL